MSAKSNAMADSTVRYMPETKVFDLHKGLKCERESISDKVELLLSRLRATVSQDELVDVNLDSEEIDSHGVLEYEDDTSHAFNEELALSELPSPVNSTTDINPPRMLKRKMTSTDIFKSEEAKMDVAKWKDAQSEDAKSSDSKESASKKSRAILITAAPVVTVKAKITADMDTKTRLELRAKRFGLPVKMSEDQARNRPKEARKERFGQNVFAKRSTITVCITVAENIEKLKKRAARFGESVSKLMTDIEKFELVAGKTQSKI